MPDPTTNPMLTIENQHLIGFMLAVSAGHLDLTEDQTLIARLAVTPDGPEDIGRELFHDPKLYTADNLEAVAESFYGSASTLRASETHDCILYEKDAQAVNAFATFLHNIAEYLDDLSSSAE